MVTYGDGVADVDIRALVDFHRSHGQAGHRHHRSARARASASWTWTARAASSSSPRSRSFDGWVSAGFFVFQPPRLRLPRQRRDCILEREPLERLAARGPADGLPARGLLFRHGHVPRIQAPERALGRRQGALEGLGHEERVFWRDRPDASSPGRRAWSAAGWSGACWPPGADVVCLVRDWVPQSELVRAGLLERVKVVRGDVRDQAAAGAGRSANTRSTPSSTWPRRPSSASPTATRSPPSRPTSAAPGPCWRPAAAARREADRAWPPPTRPTATRRSCPTTRTRRCKGSIPTTSASPAPT